MIVVKISQVITTLLTMNLNLDSCCHIHNSYIPTKSASPLRDLVSPRKAASPVFFDKWYPGVDSPRLNASGPWLLAYNIY